MNGTSRLSYVANCCVAFDAAFWLHRINFITHILPRIWVFPHLGNYPLSAPLVGTLVNQRNHTMLSVGRKVWKVQPSTASSCCSRGLIEEVIRESRSPQHVTHLPYVWDLLLAQHRHWYKGRPNFPRTIISKIPAGCRSDETLNWQFLVQVSMLGE